VSKLTTDVVTYCTEASNQKSKYAYRKILFYKKSTDYNKYTLVKFDCLYYIWGQGETPTKHLARRPRPSRLNNASALEVCLITITRYFVNSYNGSQQPIRYPISNYGCTPVPPPKQDTREPPLLHRQPSRRTSPDHEGCGIY